uniref:BTB domain-containing protein n=1 Tax=Panagrolaimus superbus TaxID=310955 RepID=A0A914Y082_9BILA
MSLCSQKTVQQFGFETTWEIDQTVIAAGSRINTTPKFIEGLPEVRWHLECNPKEDIYCRFTHTSTKYLSFYFHIASKTNLEGKIYVKCSCEEEKGPQYLSITGTEQTKKIDLRKIAHEEFFNPSKSFISYGKVSVTVSGSFSFTEKSSNCLSMIYDPTEWKAKFVETLPHDFDIIVDNENIQISKLFLATESDVFERMFEANFTEATERKVVIQGYSMDTVKNAIDYCYGKDIGAFINEEENAIQLLLFTNQYNFVTLKPKMEKYFSSKISPENIEKLAAISDKANALELRQSCVNFVQGLLNTSPTWPNGELPEFDPKFMRDVVSQALTKKL